MENSIDKLTALQKELGYSEGDLSEVALLGLVGEAGEVLNETTYSSDSGYSEYIVKSARQAAENVDELKKSIRSGLVKADIDIRDGHQDLFVKELADTLYYLNILAMNQGLTLFDLATVSHDKVRAKMQTPGGSSEQFQEPVPVVDIVEAQPTPNPNLVHFTMDPLCGFATDYPHYEFKFSNSSVEVTCRKCQDEIEQLPF